MNWLLASDLHLTTRPDHEYRWEFMDWLADQAIEHDARAVFLLGDLSDAKDNHSAVMVNRVVHAISKLSRICPVHIMYGNHDGPSPDRAYWKFLSELSNVSYYVENVGFDLCVAKGIHVKVLLSPWGTEAEAIAAAQTAPPDYMFMHASVDGVKVENGQVLQGGTPAKFLPPGAKTKVWSGDIHLSQVVGDVEYVGAPYQCHYGDGFPGRIIKLDPAKRTHESICWGKGPTLHSLKLSADHPPSIPQRVKAGDRVKIAAQATASIMPSDWHEWVRGVKKLIEEAGATYVAASLTRAQATRETRGPSARRSDESIVRSYASTQEYDEATVAVGVELIK